MMRKLLFVFSLLLATAPAAAQQTINQLSAGTALGGTEQIPMFQTSNPAVTTTPAALKTYIGAGNALFGTTTGNTANNIVTMSNTTVGVKDSGTALSSLAPLASPTFTGTVTMPDSSTITSSGISGTTINNSIIGGSTPAAASFTTLSTSGTITSTGAAFTAGGANGAPVNFTISAPTQTGANNGSNMTVRAANNSQASGTNNGGSISVTGGNASGAGSTGNGGSVVITAGTSVGGTAGNIQLASATALSAALTYGGVTLSNAVTGTGNMVLSTSPTLVTPVLGTPSSGTLGSGINLGGVTAAFGSDAKGDIYTNGGSSNVITRLAIGTTGQCLVVASALPSWGSCGGGGSTITANSTATSGFTAGQVLYSDGSLVQASTVKVTGGNIFAVAGSYMGISSAAAMEFVSTAQYQIFVNNSGPQVNLASTGTMFSIPSNYCFDWSGTSNNAGATIDTTMCRQAGGAVEINSGTGAGAGGTLLLATLTASATVKTGGYTVATLPTAGTAGRKAYVTDQLTACVLAGAALTGGGAVVCPVFDNGTAWVGD